MDQKNSILCMDCDAHLGYSAVIIEDALCGRCYNARLFPWTRPQPPACPNCGTQWDAQEGCTVCGLGVIVQGVA